VKVSGLDHRFSRPHQKRGDTSPRWVRPMRSIPARGSPRVHLSGTLPRVGMLLVLLAVGALLAVSPAHAAYGGYEPEAPSWTNGSVLCNFSATLPSVTVSADGLNGTGMGAGLDQVNELSPTGLVVASAVTSSVDWDPENETTAQSFALSYSEPLNVTNVSAPAGPSKMAQISVDFALARTPSNAAQADVVSFQVSVQDWPWQSPQDTLALVVPIWSAFSTTEHVVVSSSTAPKVESVRNSNDQPLEYFEAGSAATTGTGSFVAVSAETTFTDGVATTTLTLGPGVGGASAVTYQATLGITPSTKLLGLPLYDYAAVAGGAGLLALVVGVGTRRVRRRPSDLTYVEEPE
jgi:hypothetical protein